MVSNLLKFKSGCTFPDDLLRKYITKIYYDFRSIFFKRAHTCVQEWGRGRRTENLKQALRDVGLNLMTLRS